MPAITAGTEVPNMREETLEKIVWCKPEELDGAPLPEQDHSDAEIDHFQRTIYDYTGAQPIIIDRSGSIVAGHGRIKAARLLGIDEVPTLPLPLLTDDDVEHYIQTLVLFGRHVGWTREMLEIDLQHLLKINALVQAANDDANSIIH